MFASDGHGTSRTRTPQSHLTHIFMSLESHVGVKMKRTLSTGAVVLLIILAGCSGVLSGGDDGVEGPDGPSTETGEATETTETVETVDYPEGASAEGIDTEVIRESHEDTLESFDFKRVLKQRNILNKENVTRHATVVVDRDQQRATLEVSVGETEFVNYYADGRYYREEVESDGSRSYTSNHENNEFDSLMGQYIHDDTVAEVLASSELEAIEVRSSGDSTLIVYNVTGQDQSKPDKFVPVDGGTVAIDTEGVVRVIDVTLDKEDVETAEMEIRFEEVGDIEVEPPEWIDEVEE